MPPLLLLAAERGVLPSAGGCDEFLRLFVYRTTMPQARLDELQGKLILEEGENIALKVRPLNTLWKCSDAKALCSLALYTNLKEQIAQKEQQREALKSLVKTPNF